MLSKWIIDHCHVTGKGREYICHNCNIGLGSFRDNVVLLNSAVQYLEKHQKRIADEISS